MKLLDSKDIQIKYFDIVRSNIDQICKKAKSQSLKVTKYSTDKNNDNKKNIYY